MNKEIVLITGASRGIGARLALEFASSGYFVIINFLKEDEKASEVLKKIKAQGAEAQTVKADISDPVQVRNMVRDIVKSRGRIDVLVNNAGITKNRTIAKMSETEWDDVIRTDLSAVFYLTRECSKIMIKNKSGSIINISSIIGLRGQFGTGNYSSAKAGVISLTKSSAKELGRFKVRVNAVLPGYHLTDMGQNSTKDYLDKVKQESVLSETTDIDELSRFIVFLSKIKTVSGQVFNWDSRVI
ncbi:MAG: SDR family NAD(P)-dependent oxidoreductase [Elusimicrobia bacterium]|nr:SDR family NAD(P)-dependent oxidoreductase [Candidatus Liberimonas magnetica]